MGLVYGVLPKDFKLNISLLDVLKEFDEPENGNESIEEVSQFLRQFTKNEHEVLGIHFERQSNTDQPVLKASHWVGIVWIEEDKLAVRVEPKIRVEPKRGYSVEISMLDKCLRFPQIAERLWEDLL